MFQLSSNKKTIVIISTALFSICLVLSLINIAFEVNNNQMTADINQYSEEKENLRARYLSEIALNKLNSRAGAMDMQHAIALDSHKVSSKRATLKRNKLLKAQSPQPVKPRISISGY